MVESVHHLNGGAANVQAMRIVHEIPGPCPRGLEREAVVTRQTIKFQSGRRLRRAEPWRTDSPLNQPLVAVLGDEPHVFERTSSGVKDIARRGILQVGPGC